jgi:AcrR family transcriptional regulator
MRGAGARRGEVENVPDSRSRTRLAPHARRALIIERATELIAEGGYNTFTLLRLAEACEMTRRGIDHYFGSREEILIAVLQYRDELDIESLSPHGTPDGESSTWAVLDDVVRRNITQPEIVRLYAILNAESIDPSHPAHRYFLERERAAKVTVANAARGWHENPEEFAAHVLALMDGLQVQWLREPQLDLLRLWQRAGDSLSREQVSLDLN